MTCLSCGTATNAEICLSCEKQMEADFTELQKRQAEAQQKHLDQLQALYQCYGSKFMDKLVFKRTPEEIAASLRAASDF